MIGPNPASGLIPPGHIHPQSDHLKLRRASAGGGTGRSADSPFLFSMWVGFVPLLQAGVFRVAASSSTPQRRKRWSASNLKIPEKISV